MISKDGCLNMKAIIYDDGNGQKKTSDAILKVSVKKIEIDMIFHT